MTKNFFLKLLFPLVLLAFFLTQNVSAATYQNEPDGFRDLKWGTELQEIKESMTYLNSGTVWSEEGLNNYIVKTMT